MGRTRTKSKLQRQVPPQTSTIESPGAASPTTPSISALIGKAQSIIEQCDYDLASQFIRRILQNRRRMPRLGRCSASCSLKLG
ncbi:hypothetical protein BJ322DRAFT_413384 [Thelephora terrestris]|uniref:Uncharacterized protein n=1 Tax=Thelephora terrestris TaxID=56493 RepID=A0A9P6HMR7_9AGAM|nr:hypothetical protein BJ322DRAFT_413384 [Thelephora terrestris]